jgi:hypothetical protein
MAQNTKTLKPALNPPKTIAKGYSTRQKKAGARTFQCGPRTCRRTYIVDVSGYPIAMSAKKLRSKKASFFLTRPILFGDSPAKAGAYYSVFRPSDGRLLPALLCLPESIDY